LKKRWQATAFHSGRPAHPSTGDLRIPNPPARLPVISLDSDHNFPQMLDNAADYSPLRRHGSKNPVPPVVRKIKLKPASPLRVVSLTTARKKWMIRPPKITPIENAFAIAGYISGLSLSFLKNLDGFSPAPLRTPSRITR
jgi:hypothetical protein